MECHMSQMLEFDGAHLPSDDGLHLRGVIKLDSDPEATLRVPHHTPTPGGGAGSVPKPPAVPGAMEVEDGQLLWTPRERSAPPAAPHGEETSGGSRSSAPPASPDGSLRASSGTSGHESDEAGSPGGGGGGADSDEASARAAKRAAKAGRAKGAAGASADADEDEGKPSAAAAGGAPVPVKRQRQQRPRISMPADGFVWRKYGTKSLAETPNMRAYFWCVNKESGCQARKRVDHQQTLPFGSVSVNIMYDGEHNHPPPLLKQQLDFGAAFPGALGSCLPPGLASAAASELWSQWRLAAAAAAAAAAAEKEGRGGDGGGGCGMEGGQPLGSDQVAARYQESHAEMPAGDLSPSLAALQKLLFAPLPSPDGPKGSGSHGKLQSAPHLTGAHLLQSTLPADCDAPPPGPRPPPPSYRATGGPAPAHAEASPLASSLPQAALGEGEDDDAFAALLGDEGAAAAHSPLLSRHLAPPHAQPIGLAPLLRTRCHSASCLRPGYPPSSFLSRPHAPLPVPAEQQPSLKRAALGHAPGQALAGGGGRGGGAMGPAAWSLQDSAVLSPEEALGGNALWQQPLPPAAGSKPSSADSLDGSASYGWGAGGGGALPFKEEAAESSRDTTCTSARAVAEGGTYGGCMGGGVRGVHHAFEMGGGGPRAPHALAAGRRVCPNCHCVRRQPKSQGCAEEPADVAQGMPRRLGLSRAYSHPLGAPAPRQTSAAECHLAFHGARAAAAGAGQQARLPPTSERLLRQLALPQWPQPQHPEEEPARQQQQQQQLRHAEEGGQHPSAMVPRFVHLAEADAPLAQRVGGPSCSPHGPGGAAEPGEGAALGGMAAADVDLADADHLLLWSPVGGAPTPPPFRCPTPPLGAQSPSHTRAACGDGYMATPDSASAQRLATSCISHLAERGFHHGGPPPPPPSGPSPLTLPPPMRPLHLHHHHRRQQQQQQQPPGGLYSLPFEAALGVGEGPFSHLGGTDIASLEDLMGGAAGIERPHGGGGGGGGGALLDYIPPVASLLPGVTHPCLA